MTDTIGKAPSAHLRSGAKEISPEASFEGEVAARPTRLFPAEALRLVLGLPSITALAIRCRVGRGRMQHYVDHGMSELVADRLAVRVGLHPSEVWSDWFEEAS